MTLTFEMKKCWSKKRSKIQTLWACACTHIRTQKDLFGVSSTPSLYNCLLPFKRGCPALCAYTKPMATDQGPVVLFTVDWYCPWWIEILVCSYLIQKQLLWSGCNQSLCLSGLLSPLVAFASATQQLGIWQSQYSVSIQAMLGRGFPLCTCARDKNACMRTHRSSLTNISVVCIWYMIEALSGLYMIYDRSFRFMQPTILRN